jgi:hypothetical protein
MILFIIIITVIVPAMILAGLIVFAVRDVRVSRER